MTCFKDYLKYLLTYRVSKVGDESHSGKLEERTDKGEAPDRQKEKQERLTRCRVEPEGREGIRMCRRSDSHVQAYERGELLKATR